MYLGVDVDGSLLDGAKNISEAVTEVLNATCTEVLEKMPCAVIDCMRLVIEINPKPRSVETGDDLANEFLQKLDLKTQDATLVITAFDMYVSLCHTEREEEEET